MTSREQTSVHPTIHPTIHPSIHPSISPSISPSTSPPTHEPSLPLSLTQSNTTRRKPPSMPQKTADNPHNTQTREFSINPSIPQPHLHPHISRTTAKLRGAVTHHRLSAPHLHDRLPRGVRLRRRLIHTIRYDTMRIHCTALHRANEERTERPILLPCRVAAWRCRISTVRR